MTKQNPSVFSQMNVRHMFNFVETWQRGEGRYFRECAGLEIAAEKDPGKLDDPIWLYVYGNRMTFTNVEGDVQGLEGSSFTALLGDED